MYKLTQSLLTIAEMDILLTEAREEVEKHKTREEELEEELERAHERIYELEQALENVPKVGRPLIYGTDIRNQVRAYYNSGHTCRETAAKFNISLATIGRIVS